MRTSEVKRATKETDVRVKINLDGSGRAGINTGIGFFDHMLTAFAVHSGYDLEVMCKGDLEVDTHHTVEDIGIVLGEAFREALGNEKIIRYGVAFIPMDEALARCVLDVSGRAYFVYDAIFQFEKMGDLETQMVREFFQAFAFNSKITLHMSVLYGINDHHKCEALFKSFAYALSRATEKSDRLLSSKGAL